MRFRFDYSKTMLLKLGIGLPDNKGGCKLSNTFEQALEKIKAADALTLGAPKIVYLVGWQYLGHDDKYPAFFEVNEYAKREQDATARDSLLWLMREARRYHTTVSLHINLSDAYPDSPLWDTYLQNDLILCKANGKPKPTGVWNGRTAYQVRFAEEYKSGFFQKRAEQLLELVPELQTAGTIHVDAFFVRRGKNTTIAEEKKYRRKMIEWFLDKGMDVTSEFIYRELACGYRSLWGKSDTVGLIPAVWNLRMTQRDYLRYPPQLLAGGQLAMGIQWDKDLQYLFYGNAHGEQNFGLNGTAFQQAFTREFALKTVPYLFLNAHKLRSISGVGKARRAHFDGGVQTAVRDQAIYENDRRLKSGETLCLPVAWPENAWYAFSGSGGECEVYVPFEKVRVYRVGAEGERLLTEAKTNRNLLKLTMEKDTGYRIEKQS